MFSANNLISYGIQQGLNSVVHVGKQLKFRNGTGTGIES